VESLGTIESAFERFKSAFKIQKVYLKKEKKKYTFGKKKIETTFKGKKKKTLKIVKTHF
jgi:hypothetical protein